MRLVLTTVLLPGVFAVASESALALPLRDEIVRAAAEAAERTWRAANAQPPTVSSRDLFSAALAWCEAGTHSDRLEKLFDLAAQMQDRNPQSRTYGNFRWSWHHEGVWDANAVSKQCGAAVMLKMIVQSGVVAQPA